MARPVERWLGTFMCTQYTDTFEAYGYKTLQSVCQLDVHHLRAMGVLPEHCEKIMENVSVLRQSYMGKMGGSGYGDNSSQTFMREGQMPGGLNYQQQGNSALQMDHLPGMPPAYQGQGYCKQPGQGQGGDQSQLFQQQQQQQQQQIYNMRAAGYVSQMGALPRQPYPASGQYGLSEAPPRYPSTMGRPNVAAAAAAAVVAGGTESNYSLGGVPAPVHHHLRNARSSQNPQLVADNILHMASATYPCNGPQVIPPGINKFHTPRMASPKQMMSPDVQMAVRQSMGASSGQFDMNHMSPTSGKANQMWPNADGCCSVPMQCTPHQMSPHMVTQQDSCYGNQFHYSAKSGMMSPDTGHMMSPDPSHMMSPDAGHMMSPESGHMMSIRSPSASIQSGPSVASTSPGPMCSPAPAGSLCSPHADHSPASITSPALRSPAGQPCVQPAMMHGLQHGAQLSMGQQQHPFMSTDQYTMYTPYSQPYQPCGQPVSSSVSQNFGVHQSNPLQSLQKLVMLPESQVVNPKSVVSEACLSDRGDGAGTAPPPGKRKRCMDGVHCGSEDETDPLGPRTDQVDNVSGQCEPDMSYFQDPAVYSMGNACRKPAGEVKAARRRHRQSKKAKTALAHDEVDSVSLAPNLNCTPVAGTGQPEGTHSRVLTNTQTHVQNDTQTQSVNVANTYVENDTQTHVHSNSQAHIQSDTQTHVQCDTQTHVQSDSQHHSVSNDKQPNTSSCGAGDTSACVIQAGRSNSLVMSSASAASPHSVKCDDKTKKSHSRKHAKSAQPNVASSKPCVSSPAKTTSIGESISTGKFTKEKGMKSPSTVQHKNGAISSLSTAELGCDSKLADTRRSSGIVQTNPADHISNHASGSCNSYVESKIKQTTICSPVKDGKVKVKTMTSVEECKLGTTSVSLEQGNVQPKARGIDRKQKIGAVVNCAVGSGTTKCGDTSLTPTGKDTTRSQASVLASKSLYDSPSRVSTVRMSSPKPMRPQQVDLTKIGKDPSGQPPKTNSRRLPRPPCVDGTNRTDNASSRVNGDLSHCHPAVAPKARPVLHKSEHNTPGGDNSKSVCSTRKDAGTKSETIQHGAATCPAAAFSDKDSNDLLHTGDVCLPESGNSVKSNGLFMDKANCKNSVQKTKRKRRKNAEKQTAGVETNQQKTTPTTGHKPESPGCLASTNQTKVDATNTADDAAGSDEDGLIHVKRESAKKVYGRSPDKKTLLNSAGNESTSPEENALPTEKKVLSSDEKTLPSNKNVLPTNNEVLSSDDKTVTSNKTVLPLNKKVLPSGEKVFPSSKELLSSDEKLLCSDGKQLPLDETSSSNDCVAEADPEDTKKTVGEGTEPVDESLEASGRGKRKRMPNRYFNFGGEVVWFEVPSTFSRKRLHKDIADNSKTVNRKEARMTKTSVNCVDKLRRQKADMVDHLLQNQAGRKAKNGMLKALSARNIESLSLDDELPLSVLCKKKPVATVLPLTSVQTDHSPRKCIKQKQPRQLDVKDVSTRLHEKHMTRDEPPTCIDIVTLVAEEPPEQDSSGRMDGGQTDGSEKEVEEMEVEEVEEEEYVLCPDTCQTLDLFVPDAIDAGSDDKRSEMEIIDCDSDSEKPDMDGALLADTAAFNDESGSPSQLHTLLPGKTTDAIYIISSSEDEQDTINTDTVATHKDQLLQATCVNQQKNDKIVSGHDPTCDDTRQMAKGRPMNNIASRCKDQRSRGSKPRGQRKKSKRRTCFDYDDDSADERLKNHLTRAYSNSQSGKGSKATNKDRVSIVGHGGPYVRLKGCKETPILCEVVSLANDDMEKTNKPHPGKSYQGHKHSAPVANLSFKLIDSEPFTCVFCGKGSCFRDLSDLFGPYHPEGANDDLVSKRRTSRESVSKLGSVGDDVLPQEMWLHEDCAVWASGVYLVGYKLHGLDDAVAAAQQTTCSACKCPGATLGCYNKGCCLKYHYLCALDKECHLDEENFSMLCPRHKDRKVKMVGQSSTVT